MPAEVIKTIYKLYNLHIDSINFKDSKIHQLPTLFRAMEIGGAREDRTPDLLRARQALSQLSYGPENFAKQNFSGGSGWNRTSDLTLIRGAL